jgi:hypothetical protein
MNRKPRKPHGPKVSRSFAPELSKVMGSLSALNELSAVTEKLRPVLENAVQLQSKFEAVYTALQEVSAENVVLRGELALQRAIVLRMFARGLEEPLANILSMELAVQEELAQQREPDGNATPWTNADSDQSLESSNPS